MHPCGGGGGGGGCGGGGGGVCVCVCVREREREREREWVRVTEGDGRGGGRMCLSKYSAGEGESRHVSMYVHVKVCGGGVTACVSMLVQVVKV